MLYMFNFIFMKAQKLKHNEVSMFVVLVLVIFITYSNKSSSVYKFINIQRFI